MVKLYLHSPIRLHNIVFNELSPGIILPTYWSQSKNSAEHKSFLFSYCYNAGYGCLATRSQMDKNGHTQNNRINDDTEWAAGWGDTCFLYWTWGSRDRGYEEHYSLRRNVVQSNRNLPKFKGNRLYPSSDSNRKRNKQPGRITLQVNTRWPRFVPPKRL
jgi:hypothetical protein